ncbi:9459_t:CDS:1, partial [Racocetra fulgida]
FIITNENAEKVEIWTSYNDVSKEINIVRMDSISNIKNSFPEIIPAHRISLE